VATGLSIVSKANGANLNVEYWFSCRAIWMMRQLRSWATEHTIEPMFQRRSRPESDVRVMRRLDATSASLGMRCVRVKTHVVCVKVKIAVKVLNRMLELGRPVRVRGA